MGRGRKIGVYLMLAAALTLLLLLACPAFWAGCAAFVSGRQTAAYIRSSANSDGAVCAVGVRNGTWVLTQGVLSGGWERSRTLDSLGISDVVTVDQLCACSNGGAVLSLYERREELACRAYYLAPDAGDARLIYSVPCKSRADVRLFGMTESGGAAAFLLRQGDGTASFRYVLGEDSVRRLCPAAAEESALFVLPDGRIASVLDGSLSIGDDVTDLPADLRPIEGWRLTDGVCLLDGANGALWRMDGGGGRWTQLLALEEAGDVIAASVSPDGGVLLLTDGGGLLRLWDGTLRDCSQALYRPKWQIGLTLLLAAAGVLLIALALWYFLCEYRRMQLPLAVRKGAALALLLALLVLGGIRWAAAPYFASWAGWTAERYLNSTASDAAALLNVGQADFLLRDNAFYRDDGGERTALAALQLGSAWRQTAERALREGEAFLEHNAGGIGYYSRFVKTGTDRLTVVWTESGPYLAEAAWGLRMMSRLLWGMAGIVLVAVLAMLLGLHRRFRRLTAGLDALHAGKIHARVADRGGDEISALADSLNDLADSLRASGAADARREELYARFLPARIAQLLGEDSVERIGKQSFASRRMIAMHVGFTFEERVYESRSKGLFDNINEITEYTAKLISARGGTILSFSHEGFDAFFPPEDAAPISAAVAICQEAAAINRSRMRRNISPVRLHIALDEDEVMLGVVGDESRMQATAVSASFNTTRMLSALFSKLDAGILCTERIERRAEEYGRRYIGKTHDGAELVRVYEIYDGDPQPIRQGKAETARSFSDGIYTLYAGDYAAAKRTFLEISRRCGGDGAARFCLYLADRFEKEPPEEVCLDA